MSIGFQWTMGGRRYLIACLLALVLAAVFVAKGLILTQQAQNYAQERQAYKTQLRRAGPSPQRYEKLALPANATAITYPSGDLQLKAWLVNPKGRAEPLATVIYLHGGFAFDLGDYEAALPFVDAGYAVMYPFLRGENGNPGNFELMYGEVDDALAAARWLIARGTTRIAFFGHSIGGGTAELAALRHDGPLLLSGSAGALYPPEVFRSWGEGVPFDATDRKEARLRTFLPHLSSLKRRHVAYVGSEEPQAPLVPEYREMAARHDTPLSIVIVPGDHQASLAPAVQAFLAELGKLP
jgi:acetyl esterase/lipase